MNINKLISENTQERIDEFTNLEKQGYSFEKILEFCKLNIKTVYNQRFIKIPLEKTIYIGEIILKYEIDDDFPEALDNYGTRDLHRIITIIGEKQEEKVTRLLLSKDILDFERSFETETSYFDYVEAMNKDIDYIFGIFLDYGYINVEKILTIQQ